MDKLTKRSTTYKTFTSTQKQFCGEVWIACDTLCDKMKGNCDNCPINDAMQKLASYEDIGSVEQFAEWAAAEKEGRLVVLPCKVGDAIFFTMMEYVDCENNFGEEESEQICSTVVESIAIKSPYWVINDAIEFEPSDFGKSIFLTLEAAIAAKGE